MPRRQNEYAPGQYKTLTHIKELLVPYEIFMDVVVDQKDSYYLALPDKEGSDKEGGTMFAAIQIMDVTVDLFIGALINDRNAFDESLLKGVEGIIDAKGIIHVFRLNKSLREIVKEIIDFSASIALRKQENE